MDPRPKYDRSQHNPTNPILTEFRNVGGDNAGAWVEALVAYRVFGGYDEWEHPSSYFHGLLTAKPHHEEVVHAHKVLTRLATLEKVA